MLSETKTKTLFVDVDLFGVRKLLVLVTGDIHARYEGVSPMIFTVDVIYMSCRRTVWLIARLVIVNCQQGLIARDRCTHAVLGESKKRETEKHCTTPPC